MAEGYAGWSLAFYVLSAVFKCLADTSTAQMARRSFSALSAKVSVPYPRSVTILPGPKNKRRPVHSVALA